MALLSILFLLALIPFSTALTNIFNFTSFSDSDQSIRRFGNAVVTKSDALELTTNVSVSSSSGIGWAIYNSPIKLHDSATGFAADFESIFSFEIIPPQDTCSGDGLAFFIAHANWSDNNGLGGGGLGLFNTSVDAINSQIIAIEFDTYKNTFDPSANHMGIDVNSANSTVAKDWISDGSRSLNGTAFVVYNSTTGTLSSLLSYNNYTTPLKISLDINLTALLPETVFIGFSASVGTCLEGHQITAWSFSATVPKPVINPPSPAPDTVSSLLQNTSIKQNKMVIVLVACLVPLLITVLVITIVVIRIRKKNAAKSKEEEMDQDEDTDGIVDATMNFETGPRNFRYSDLDAATNGFNEGGKLGQGGFGAVYRGILRDTNEVVAVKRFLKGSSQGKTEYMAEVTVISRLRHRNLVKLIGWCHQRGEFLLVYEYMEGGSLDSNLFNSKGLPVLPWAQRKKVVLDLASAVQYLHEEWEQCVVHRDIKLSNIMVDSEFNARLGDFGLARLTDHGFAPRTTMNVLGTMGYMAPEYVITGKASTHSDVYSFGVVLLEITTGRRAIRPIGEKEVRLIEWIWELHEAGSLMEAVDERLGSHFDQQEVERMILVGLWCVHPDPERRPTMKLAITVLSFQAEMPILPKKMPVPFYGPPPINDINDLLTSSNGTTTTWKTVSSTESSEAPLLWQV